MCPNLRDGQISTPPGFQQRLSPVMPHGLRSSTVPLITSSRTTKSVTKRRGIHDFKANRRQERETSGRRQRRPAVERGLDLHLGQKAGQALRDHREEKSGHGQKRTANTRTFSPLLYPL